MKWGASDCFWRKVVNLEIVPLPQTQIKGSEELKRVCG